LVANATNQNRKHVKTQWVSIKNTETQFHDHARARAQTRTQTISYFKHGQHASKKQETAPEVIK
jgi:hypothetical protein